MKFMKEVLKQKTVILLCLFICDKKYNLQRVRSYSSL